MTAYHKKELVGVNDSWGGGIQFELEKDYLSGTLPQFSVVPF
jgi:hypothetical protein